MTIRERVQRKKDELGWHWVRGEHRLDPSPAHFSELAEIVGCPLDDDYREFVTALGGGAFDESVLVVGPEPHPWQGLMAEVFFGFYGERSYDIRHELRAARSHLPPCFLPLVMDPGANSAVYAAGGEHKGKVFFRDKSFREFASKHNIADVYAELEGSGISTERIDIAQAVLAWERLHARELAKPPGFGNLYLLATTLEDFVSRIERYEEPAADA